MPYYSTHSDRRPPKLLVAGLPSYFFGSWAQETAPTRFWVNLVSLTSNVATVTGAVVEGNIPSIGSLISIDGTQSNGGIFNVQEVAITAVNINATTGQGTISFALTSGNVGATADAGLAIIPQPEVPETVQNGASIPVTIPFNDPRTAGDRTVTVTCTFPAMPTALNVQLQTALMDQDSQYQEFESTGEANVVTISGGAVTQYSTQFTFQMSRFYRLALSGLTGAGTIVAKIQA
jgi:hypothetical protein